MTSKGCAFLMDMGTGKTITTIALAGTLHHKHKITQMLVVCPKSIVDVWEQEFEKFADFPYQLAVLDGTSAKKADTIRYMIGNGLQIIVVNYESCWRLEAELTRWHPDMIVCDESSKIKNPQAKCSKALHRLGKISSYNLILTGTPITNSPLDFFSQYKFLDESIFGGSFYSFRAYYAILGGFQNHQIVGYKHLAELVEKAHSIAYRIRIDEAVDLPEFVEFRMHDLSILCHNTKILKKWYRDSLFQYILLLAVVAHINLLLFAFFHLAFYCYFSLFAYKNCISCSLCLHLHLAHIFHILKKYFTSFFLLHILVKRLIIPE